MDCSDWSNGIQYQTFDTRPDTEFTEIMVRNTLDDVEGNIWRALVQGSVRQLDQSGHAARAQGRAK